MRGTCGAPWLGILCAAGGGCALSAPVVDYNGKTCADAGDCPAPYTCQAGFCRGDGGSVAGVAGLDGGGACSLVCDGGCFDKFFDQLNCGACGDACAVGTLCLGGQCQVPAQLTTPRAALAVAAAPDGRLYAFGGGNAWNNADVGPTTLLATLEIYDPLVNQWEPGPDGPDTIVFSTGAAGPGGVLYFVGGSDVDNFLQSVEVYDPNGVGWSTLAAPMLAERSGPGVVYLSPDTLEVMGGFDGDISGPLETVSDYSFDAGTWTDLSGQMSEPRDSFAAVVVGGDIFAIGGTEASTRALGLVDVGSIAAGTWQLGPSLSQARSRFAAAVGPDGTLYAVGGADQNGVPLASVETLAPGALAWSSGVPLPVARSNFAAAIAGDGRLYVVGGIVDNRSGDGALTPTVEVYDFQLGTWTP